MPTGARRPWRPGLMALLVVLALGLAWFQPPAPLQGAHWVGYAVCHQIPERSFWLNGRPLPLCARCTGTFLGAFLGFAVILARRRARCRQLPPVPVLALLALFFVLWGIDGLNSYLTLFAGAPHLYQPHNLLRLATGLLNGLMLSNVVYPVFSFTVWAETRDEPSVKSLGELAVLVGVAAALWTIIWLGWPPAVYLLAMLSVLGTLTLLWLVNTLIAVIALRRESRARRWRDLAGAGAIGALAMLAEIGALDALRAWITHLLGLSF